MNKLIHWLLFVFLLASCGFILTSCSMYKDDTLLEITSGGNNSWVNRGIYTMEKSNSPTKDSWITVGKALNYKAKRIREAKNEY